MSFIVCGRGRIDDGCSRVYLRMSSAYMKLQTEWSDSLTSAVNVHIRPFREDDLAAIKRLFNASFPVHYDDAFFSCIQNHSFHNIPLECHVAEMLVEVALCVRFHIGCARTRWMCRLPGASY